MRKQMIANKFEGMESGKDVHKVHNAEAGSRDLQHKFVSGHLGWLSPSRNSLGRRTLNSAFGVRNNLRVISQEILFSCSRYRCGILVDENQSSALFCEREWTRLEVQTTCCNSNHIGMDYEYPLPRGSLQDVIGMVRIIETPSLRVKSLLKVQPFLLNVRSTCIEATVSAADEIRPCHEAGRFSGITGFRWLCSSELMEYSLVWLLRLKLASGQVSMDKSQGQTRRAGRRICGGIIEASLLTGGVVSAIEHGGWSKDREIVAASTWGRERYEEQRCDKSESAYGITNGGVDRETIAMSIYLYMRRQ